MSHFTIATAFVARPALVKASSPATAARVLGSLPLMFCALLALLLLSGLVLGEEQAAAKTEPVKATLLVEDAYSPVKQRDHVTESVEIHSYSVDKDRLRIIVRIVRDKNETTFVKLTAVVLVDGEHELFSAEVDDHGVVAKGTDQITMKRVRDNTRFYNSEYLNYLISSRDYHFACPIVLINNAQKSVALLGDDLSDELIRYFMGKYAR